MIIHFSLQVRDVLLQAHEYVCELDGFDLPTTLMWA
jgi:hypothetical protein